MQPNRGVKHAAAYYKTLELDKDKALKFNEDNFEEDVSLLVQSKECTQRWINNIESSSKPISMGPMNRRIETDSS